MPDYAKVRVAVNVVLLTLRGRAIHAFLEEREKEPYKGRLELPGGLMLEGETAEATVKRKLAAILGQRSVYFKQFAVFTEPKRDPRERAVSIGYIALIPAEDAAGGTWLPADRLPALAFDHATIVKAARDQLRAEVDSHVVRQFLPPLFPLNRLQEVYEALEGVSYDNRNFRKRMLASETVEETREIERDVSHRPARLFRFKGR